MSAVSSVEIILREDTPEGLGPVLPLASLDEVEALFRTVRWAHSMYGWAFIDITDISDQWLVRPSLVVPGKQSHAAHTLHWFTECGGGEGEDMMAYYLQGAIRFDGLRVERADGTPIPVNEFVAAGDRWWKAFSERDGRLSVQAQKDDAAAGSPSWRPQLAMETAIVPAGPREENDRDTS
jgi:hypothetical protein